MAPTAPQGISNPDPRVQHMESIREHIESILATIQAPENVSAAADVLCAEVVDHITSLVAKYGPAQAASSPPTSEMPPPATPGRRGSRANRAVQITTPTNSQGRSQPYGSLTPAGKKTPRKDRSTANLPAAAAAAPSTPDTPGQASAASFLDELFTEDMPEFSPAKSEYALPTPVAHRRQSPRKGKQTQ